MYFQSKTGIVTYSDNAITKEAIYDERKKLTTSDFSGIYKDIAEVIGIEATILLHNHFKGQQITFPKKLFTTDYIVQQINITENDSNIKMVALEYGYTERRLRQILKENSTTKII